MQKQMYEKPSLMEISRRMHGSECNQGSSANCDIDCVSGTYPTLDWGGIVLPGACSNGTGVLPPVP